MDILLISGGFAWIGYIVGRFANIVWRFAVLPVLGVVAVVVTLLGVSGLASPADVFSGIGAFTQGFLTFCAEVLGTWVLYAAWLAIPFLMGFAWSAFLKRLIASK